MTTYINCQNLVLDNASSSTDITIKPATGKTLLINNTKHYGIVDSDSTNSLSIGADLDLDNYYLGTPVIYGLTFNSTTGAFATERAGFYSVSYSVLADNAAASGVLQCFVSVNGSDTLKYATSSVEYTTALEEVSLSGSCILKLDATDTVSVKYTSSDALPHSLGASGNFSIIMV